MTDLFDGLPEIFTETFGEPVDYVPAGGPARTIIAIWREEPLLVEQLGAPAVDTIKATLAVNAADVPDPKEGDRVTSRKTGAARKLVPPIQPDGKGMIICGLAI